MSPRDIFIAVLSGCMMALGAECVRWLVVTHDPLWSLGAALCGAAVLRTAVRR
jgi:hypothetical protein